MTPLFRSEAVAHQQQKLLGTVILRQPWPTLALTAFFGVLVCELVAVFFLFGFARRETLGGRLLPAGGLLHASSAQAGLVQRVHVVEGQQLREGDLMFVLSDERQGERGQTHRRVGSALAEQRELLDGDIARVRRQSEMDQLAAARRLAQVESQLAQVRAGIELQRRRAQLATQAHDRYVALEQGLAVSRQEVEDKRAEAMGQELALHDKRREEAVLMAERGSLQAELALMPVRAERDVAAIRGSLSGVRRQEAENDTRLRWEVRAPRDGRVTLVAVQPGQAVNAAEVLASLAPEGEPLEAVLYAPSRAAGQLKAGATAQVRFDALPYQKYGQFAGEVREVSRSPVPAAEAAAAGAAAQAGGMPLYRVRVRLQDGGRLPALAADLKAGMQLEATLTLEHRRFYEWALEPLLGMRQRMS